MTSGEEILNLFTKPAEAAEIKTIENQILAEAKHLSPWLWQVGDALLSEYGPTFSFSQKIYQRYGLRTVIVSSWRGLEVPAFDGVLVDPETEAIVANFSLKEFRGSSNSFQQRIRRANTKMKTFAQPEAWAKHLVSMTLPALPPRFDWHSDVLMISSSKSQQGFRHRLDALASLSRFFGAGTSRPQWLLTYITRDSRVTEADIQQSQNWQTSPDLQKALFVHESHMFEGKISCRPYLEDRGYGPRVAEKSE